MDFTGKKGEPFGSDWSLYGTVNRALWAVAIMMPIFLLFSYPSERAVRDEAKAVLEKEIAAENDRFCERWGMPLATAEHAVCVQDLIRIRTDTEFRVHAEIAESF